ncbi:helix-turn-helix domain-containing protein [Amycolatopsis nigrescens]|uniref:helix-turn-helix domain-containing protein n=1 Tax=Amycolatopsis nigrescens TaxID=381445 RepID=UPI00037BAAA2|nr:helix-turn-helix transcriptional regulator [Amycolatopsis nigrescens]
MDESSRISNARGREVGAELRRIREASGLTGQQLAEALGWSPSMVSRAEHGKRPLSEVDALLYLACCRTSRRQVERVREIARPAKGYWLRPYGLQPAEELRSLLVQEAAASAITCYEPTVLPDLLQTGDYTRALLVSAGQADDVVESRVLARAERQRQARGRRDRRLEFFVHEHAVRSVVGGHLVMHEQLMHLAAAGTTRPRYLIRLVRTSAGPFGALGSGFSVLDFPDDPPVAYTPLPTAGLFAENPADLLVYRRLLTRLDRAALSDEESRRWLAQLAVRYRHIEPVDAESEAKSA